MRIQTKAALGVISGTILFFSSWSHAQTPPPLPGTFNPQWTGWSIGEVVVRGMAAKGDDIWIGTSNGLIRFDRKKEQPQIFNAKKAGLLSNVIVSITPDQKGNVWIGTYGGGLARFDGREWELFTPYGHGSKNYGPGWVQYAPKDGLGDLWVYDLLFEPDGSMWVATWKGASHSKKEGFLTYTMDDGLVDKWVYTVERESSGVLWFGTEGGINRFDGKTWQGWTHKDGLGAAIRQPLKRPKKDDGYDEDEDHHLQQGRENQETNPNYVISSVIDAKGIKWFGTWGGGLSRFDGKTFKNYTTKDGLPGNIINAIEIDAKGMMWIGTNKGVSRFDGKAFKTFTRMDGLLGDYVFAIAIDPDGHKWFGTFGGVSRYTGE
ncbi:MAG: two-component regulator propeller domain-containing protein [Nitrospiria bacterium]